MLVGNTAYNPVTSIANLKAWYDASDTATITASGSAVTQWNDKSGNGYNVTQGTAAQRPVTGTRTQNGLNMIDFQTNDVLLASTASNWTFMSNATGCTVFVAAFYDTDNVYRWILSTGNATTVSIGAEIACSDADGLLGNVTNGNTGLSTSYGNPVKAGLTDNTAKYFSLIMDNSNATAANRLIGRINGGAIGNPNTATTAASSSNPAHALYIGGYDTAPADGFNGGICEVIIYSGVLSDANILLVNNYLAAKWGI